MVSEIDCPPKSTDRQSFSLVALVAYVDAETASPEQAGSSTEGVPHFAQPAGFPVPLTAAAQPAYIPFDPQVPPPVDPW